jgi:hypothetical protein
MEHQCLTSKANQVLDLKKVKVVKEEMVVVIKMEEVAARTALYSD